MNETDQENPVVILGDDDSANDDEPITLSHRQPSYSSLYGILIPKGGEVGSEMPALTEEEAPKEEIRKLESNPVVVLTKPSDNEEAPITLSVRQPSFSSLSGFPIPKGSSDPSDIAKLQVPIEEEETPVKSDPIIVLSQDPPQLDGPITLSVRQPSYASLRGTLVPKGIGIDPTSKPDFLKELEERNASRWQKMGYESSALQRNSTLQHFTSNGIQLGSQAPMIQSTKCFYHPSILDIAEEKEPLIEEEPIQALKLNIVGTSRKSDLKVEMPQEKSRLPNRLSQIVVHPKNSIVYKILCGDDLDDFEQIDNLITELKPYLLQCVEKGFIEEAEYVEDLMQSLKKERNEVKAILGSESPEEVQESIEKTQILVDRIRQTYETKRSRIEAEKELAIQELNLKQEEAMDYIDNEWLSPQKQKFFNKPSPKLIEMKHQSQKLLGALRFDEATMLADEITVQEQNEIKQAAERMNQAYEFAIKRQEEKKYQEEQAILASFERKILTFEQEKMHRMRPQEMKLAKLIKKREDLAEQLKKSCRMARSSGEIQKKKNRPTNLHTIDVSKGSALILPPLIKRRRTSTRASQVF